MAKYDSYHDTVATILYIAIYCDAIDTAKYFLSVLFVGKLSAQHQVIKFRTKGSTFVERRKKKQNKMNQCRLYLTGNYELKSLK